MSEKNPLTERLRPYVERLSYSAEQGNADAKQVISLYRMHQSCPSDHGTPALCGVAFDKWLKHADAR